MLKLTRARDEAEQVCRGEIHGVMQLEKQTNLSGSESC